MTNFSKLSADQCIAELIAIALAAKASAIAIRFHALERKIQVIDNGVGIVKKIMKRFDKVIKTNDEQWANYEISFDIFNRIRESCDSLIITSKCQTSMNTYVKIFKKGYVSKLIRGVNRPSIGTTISIRGFTSAINKSSKSVIYLIVSIFALFNTEVSFSLRDDMAKDVVIRISKPHNPIQVLEYICDQKIPKQNIWCFKKVFQCNFSVNGYVGFVTETRNDVCRIFVNHRIVKCAKIENLIRTVMVKMQRCYLSKTLFNKKIFYFLHIECCPGEYTVLFTRDELHITFMKPTIVNIVKLCLKNTVVKSCFKEKNFLKIRNLKQIRKEKVCCGKYDIQENLLKSPNIMSNVGFKENVLNSFTHTAVSENRMNHKPKNKMAKKTISKLGSNYLFENRNRQCDIIEKLCFLKKFLGDFQGNAVKYVKSWKCVKNMKYIKKFAFSNLGMLNGNSNENSKKTQDFLNKTSDTTSIDLQTSSSYTYTSHESVSSSQTNINASKYSNTNMHIYNDQQVKSLSEWSDWTYPSLDSRKVIFNNLKYFCSNRNGYQIKNVHQYTFLPLQLHNLLPFSHKKICNKLLENNDSPNDGTNILGINTVFNKRYQNLEVRNCDISKSPFEFKLDRNSLYKIKILKQINYEFIAAVTVQSGRKLLLLIDQHAVDERIRYEQLLEKYRVKNKEDVYISENLNTPIIITDLHPCTYELLTSHKQLLFKFGVCFKINDNRDMVINSVPKCFLKRKCWNNEIKLITRVRKLLLEIVESLLSASTVTVLPPSIHSAIAAEACHGAIKFGDPLNVKQCQTLLKSLRDTHGPTRCAHGRPSIIPLLDITNLNRGIKVKTQKKLNFVTLKNWQMKIRNSDSV